MPRTQDQLNAHIFQRRMAWEAAVEMVIPIVADHGLEPYDSSSNIFAPKMTNTKVDQNIRHIIDVAEWLLNPLP